MIAAERQVGTRYSGATGEPFYSSCRGPSAPVFMANLSMATSEEDSVVGSSPSSIRNHVTTTRTRQKLYLGAYRKELLTMATRQATATGKDAEGAITELGGSLLTCQNGRCFSHRKGRAHLQAGQ